MLLNKETKPLDGCGTRSIFERGEGDLNFEFTFSLTGYLIKTKDIIFTHS